MKKYPTPIAKFLSSKATKLAPLISEAKKITQTTIILNQSLDHELAQHIQVSRIQNGQLRLIVDSPAWATRLRYKQTEIINRFAQYTITKFIKSIHIKISPTTYISDNEKSRKKNNKKNNITLSLSSADQMRKEIEVIDNIELKNALLRITRHAK